MNKRRFIRSAVALALAGALLPAAAQTSPSRPVRLVIPFPAGGGADAMGRAVIEKIGADAAAVSLPELRDQKLAQQGMEAYPLTPEQFAAQVRREAERFSRLIKQVGITPD